MKIMTIMKKVIFAKMWKRAKSVTFCEKAHISGPRRKSFHSTAYIDGFGSPNCPKCTLGQKVRFLWKWWNFMKFMKIPLFPWKSWKFSIFEEKIATRNGHLSTAKSTFSLSGAPAARLPGNFVKFHGISWNFMNFTAFCKKSALFRPGAEILP